MQKLNDYIEEKKIKSSKTPRYGMKKLAVGLVSCILGYTVLVSPGVVHAEEVREPEAVVMEAEEEKEKEEAVLPEETEVVEEKEEIKEENALEVSEEEEKEEKNLLKASVSSVNTKEEVTEEDEAEKTEEVEKPLEKREETVEEENEEETEKKLVTLDEYNALQEEENGEDGINIEDAELISNVLGVTGDETEGEIELSEDVDPEAQKAGETEEDAITNVKITIGGAKNGEKTEIVNPTALSERINGENTDINLRAQVDFDIPEGTKA